MRNIDIVDIKTAVQRGELRVFIRGGFFMLVNTISGEVVRLNECDDFTRAKQLDGERKDEEIRR